VFLCRRESNLPQLVELVESTLSVLQSMPAALENLLGRVRATLVRVAGRDLSQVFDLKLIFDLLQCSYNNHNNLAHLSELCQKRSNRCQIFSSIKTIDLK